MAHEGTSTTSDAAAAAGAGAADAAEPATPRVTIPTRTVAQAMGEPDTAYSEWCESVGVRFNYTMHVRSLPFPLGRGVVAQDVLPADRPLLTVPRSAIMSVEEYAREDAPLAPLLAEQEALQLREDDLLAILLLHEKHVKGDASAWAEHIKRLPGADDIGNAFYLAEEDMLAMAGSNLHGLSAQMQRQVTDDYERIFPKLIEKHGEATGMTAEAFSVEGYRWAIATIWSRFLTLKLGGQPRKCMVPFLDMFNHDTSVKSVHDFDERAQALRVVSHKKWLAGEHVSIFYAPLNNCDLLQRYGFAVPHNPFDSLDIMLSMSEAAPNYQRKVEALTERGINPQAPFRLVEGTLSEPFLATLRVQRCDAEEDWEHVNNAFVGKAISPDIERAALEAAIGALKDMLSGFGDAAASAVEAEREANLQQALDLTVAALAPASGSGAPGARRRKGKGKGKSKGKGKGKGGGGSKQKAGADDDASELSGEVGVTLAEVPSPAVARQWAFACMRRAERSILLSQLAMLTEKKLAFERKAAGDLAGVDD